MQKGDIVRIIQSKKPEVLGPTEYEVQEINGSYVSIREVNSTGRPYAPQDSDISLLKKVR